jgi:alpha-tubulin suppressor-like RCC1 family protein
VRVLRTLAGAVAAVALLVVPPAPVVRAAATQPSITMVAADDAHTCALTSTGAVRCWGGNGFGQLGNGTTTKSPVPVDLSRMHDGFASITTGANHTCALTVAGRAWCWGRGESGELGTGRQVRYAFPVAVAGLSSGVRSISAGQGHTCALTTTGAVKCWGENAYGQLGTGTTLTGLAPAVVNGLSSGVISVSAGGLSTCALTSGGGVLCWGDNVNGELGDGTTTSSSLPAPVSGLASGVRAISVGGGRACALTNVGGVTCWGGGAGDAGTVPTAVPGLTGGVAAISVGGGHACALTNDDVVKCWGADGFGQLGDGTTVGSSVPVDVADLAGGATAIAAGGSHTCAVTSGGRVQCWGGNAYGQLGGGSVSSARHTPTTVDFVVYQMVGLSPSVPAGVIDRGTTVRFTAMVRPRGPASVRPVVRFVVYRRVAGAWRLDATRDVAADAQGNVSLRWGFVTPGLRYVRARALADSAYGASAWGPLVPYDVR